MTATVPRELRVLVSATRSPPVAGFFLERGATLIVDKDFSCQGSKWMGVRAGGTRSWAACSISLQPSFVKGMWTIPHGIFPGISLVNISKSLNIGAITKFVNILINATPVIAKIAGPFHRRLSCFATYADTFRLEIFDLAPVPIFFPTWEHATKNINCKIFTYVSVVYTSILNALFGGEPVYRLGLVDNRPGDCPHNA